MLRKFDVAYGMLNNSIIQLEKYGKASDFVIMLFKYNMFKIMMYMGNVDKAQVCLNQAYYLKQKHDINFDFDINPENYLFNTDPPVEEEISENSDIELSDKISPEELFSLDKNSNNESEE